MPEFPRKFLDNMKERLGDTFDLFLQAMEEKPPTSIRVNPSKGSTLFSEEQPVPWCETGKYLKVRPAFVWDPLYHAGVYYAQEASSMLFANLIDFSKPLKILDLCAAPGGKSSLILSKMNDESILVSNELVGKRTIILNENLTKWGNASVVVTCNKASDFKSFQGFFDVVLVDAPCSGEGMFRKDKGAVEQWSEGLVNQCSHIQKEILESAINLVAENGLLIYSTCTFEAHENENNIAWLYSEYEDKILPHPWQADRSWGLTTIDLETPKGNQKMFYSFPHLVKGEGLFLAGMQINHSRTFKPQSMKGEKHLKVATKAEMAILADWLKLRDHQEVFILKDEVYILPKNYAKKIGYFLSELKVRKSGVNAGKLIRNQFIPSHDLAMSGLVSDNIPRVALNLNDAMSYMERKDVVIDSNQPKGWIVFTYNGVDIGWAKNLGNRVNIHYPAEWKIRKSFPGSEVID